MIKPEYRNGVNKNFEFLINASTARFESFIQKRPAYFLNHSVLVLNQAHIVSIPAHQFQPHILTSNPASPDDGGWYGGTGEQAVGEWGHGRG